MRATGVTKGWLFAVLALGALTSCDHVRSVKIQPAPGLSVKDDVATASDAQIDYELTAFGVNQCCHVALYVKNPAEGPLSLKLPSARISSACGVEKSLRAMIFRSEKARSFQELRNDLGRSEGYADMPLKHSLRIEAQQLLRLDFFGGETWRKECLPYRFSLDVAGHDPVRATFYKIH